MGNRCHTLLPKRIALPVFASDVLSSPAYVDWPTAEVHFGSKPACC